MVLWVHTRFFSMSSRMASLPGTFRKIICQKLSPNFGEATEIVNAPMPKPSTTEVLIRNRYLGINASDINFSAGRYFADKPPPFDLGFESVGEVIEIGDDVKNVKSGQPVAYAGFGAFSEYVCVPQQHVMPLPEMNPDFVSFMVSGRTAAISLEKSGHIKKNETVLITAAAGGTGSIAVQFAKYMGCHTIGTCSSDEKVEFLKSIGCDRPINYKKESVDEVLSKEYPKGVDVVWESIGGDMFKTCLKHLAIKGRLIVIGYISHYQDDKGYKPMELGYLPPQLLKTSASVTGFLLFHYPEDYHYYHVKLMGMYERKKLKVLTDQGKKTKDGEFVGLESVTRAVEHLHSGKSAGKVVVEIPW